MKTKFIKIPYNDNVEVTEVETTLAKIRNSFKSKKLGYTCIGDLIFYYDDCFKLHDAKLNKRATSLFLDFIDHEDWLGGIVYVEKIK